MNQYIPFALLCVLLIASSTTNAGREEDVAAGMSTERKTREDCAYEWRSSEGCQACCKKFGLHQWVDKHFQGICKCHHLPQPKLL